MWRIYYDDGSMFTSEDGAWEQAPTDGVLFVTQKIGDRIVTLTGGDHYLMIDGEVIRPDDIGLMLRKWGVKFGRWTSNKQHEAVGRRVAADNKKWQR